jgi:hypothetical protein
MKLCKPLPECAALFCEVGCCTDGDKPLECTVISSREYGQPKMLCTQRQMRLLCESVQACSVVDTGCSEISRVRVCVSLSIFPSVVQPLTTAAWEIGWVPRMSS